MLSSPIHTLAKALADCTLDSSPIQISQLLHRLDILTAWFSAPSSSSNPSLDLAQAALSGRTVLELGCGQGDMTVALAGLLLLLQDGPPDSHGRVIACDPAPLDYGSPYTLGDAQGRISKSEIGKLIEWKQVEPKEWIRGLGESDDEGPDVVVLAHSIWYMSSEAYFVELLECLHAMAVSVSSRKKHRVKLLMAEWGMRTSVPAAEAHILAVEIQSAQKLQGGNVQTVIRPSRIVELARQAGWRSERQKWIERPEVADGKWEVGNVKRAVDGWSWDNVDDEVRRKIERMKALSEEGEVASMDVWTGVFGVDCDDRTQTRTTPLITLDDR